MNDHEFMVRSRITGKEYNRFDAVKLLNIEQCCKYMLNGCMPLDIYVSQDRENEKNILVFLFSREGTKELYDKWCKHEL